MSVVEVKDKPASQTHNGKEGLWRYGLIAIAGIYVIVTSYFIVNTRSRLDSFAAVQKTTIAEVQQRQDATENELNTTREAFAQQLGITERQLEATYTGQTTKLRQNQQAFERRVQTQQNQLVGEVTDQVADVRTELGGAEKNIADTRTELTSTHNDLESTKVRLDRAIGDLTGQGTLIARTREELEELKHRGDRNYYEFTLVKGAHPQAVSNVSLQLKKTNTKNNTFNLNVIADDRTIEKKDRGAAEPLQFYSGRDHLLYEVVIFTVDKNVVTGYLSTPKSAGVRMTNNYGESGAQ
jgi:hypothetical protein